MKSLARAIMWWPNMDREIENFVKSCDKCQRNRHTPAKAPLNPWIFTSTPSKVHIDYAGPINGKMIVIIIDSH